MQTHPWAPEFSRIAFQLRSYGVLAEVSLCCPPLKGRFPTYYSPVRHFPLTEVRFSFDLHVWSTPPAFVLSQDQTLHCQKVYDLHPYGCLSTHFSLAFALRFVVLIIRCWINKFISSSLFCFQCSISVNSSMNPHQLINSFLLFYISFFRFVFDNSLVITFFLTQIRLTSVRINLSSRRFPHRQELS